MPEPDARGSGRAGACRGGCAKGGRRGGGGCAKSGGARRRGAAAARACLVAAFAGAAAAFDLTCFGPGRGLTLPGEDNTGIAAMVLPNDDWARDRPSSEDFVEEECVVQYVEDGSASTCTGSPECEEAFARVGVGPARRDCPRGCTWTYRRGERPDPYKTSETSCRTIAGLQSKNEWVGVLSDQQNPPLWAPNGRSQDVLNLINKGTDISEDRITIESYRQVTTWRVINLARLFVPLLERQIQTASTAATVKIISINATDPPVLSRPLADGTPGEEIDMVWADFSLTTTWTRGEPGPWVDLSGSPQSTRHNGRPGASLNLLERDPLDLDKAHFLKSFWIGSSTWNDLSTVGGCVTPEQCETRLISPEPLHQTTYSFPGEPDIRTFIEYVVDNQQPCTGQVAAANAFELADQCVGDGRPAGAAPDWECTEGSDGKLNADEIPVALFEMGITPPDACIDGDGNDVAAGSQAACERQETGFAFQFATKSECLVPAGAAWEAEEIGSTWHCEDGFPCVDDTCTGVADVPPCTGDEETCPDGCVFEDGACSGTATAPNCAEAFLPVAGVRSTAANCPPGCTYTPDDPETGHRQFFDEQKCEFDRTDNTWVLGTTAACVGQVDRTDHPDGATMTSANQCEEARNGYTYSPYVEPACTTAAGQPVSAGIYTMDVVLCCGGYTAGGTCGQEGANEFTPPVTEKCVQPGCTGSPECASATPTGTTCPDGCTYVAESGRPGWNDLAISYSLAERTHNCEYEASGYEFRSCADSAGTTIAAASEDACHYSVSGRTWQPQVEARCLDKSVTPWVDAGVATDEMSCEYGPSGNSWYANRWIAEFQPEGQRGGLTMAALTAAYPGYVPPEARCVSQAYRDSGNSVREYKCVPSSACGGRCTEFTTPFEDCPSSQQVDNDCGYGKCTPRNLKYGNQSLVPPVFDWRCWDSCKPLPHGSSCPQLLANNFLVDELVESAAAVAEYVESFAATCDEEFGPLGYESECKSMRCHHMATVFETVCDNSMVLPPCRSTCEIFRQHRTDWGFNTSALDDCDRLTIKINISNPPNEWARSHCRALQLGDCSDFPGDDSGLCAAPIRYPGGTPCLLDSQCISGGCPLAEGDSRTNAEDLGGYCCADGLERCSEHGLCDADGGTCHCETFWAGERCQIFFIPPWMVAAGASLGGVVCLACGVYRYFAEIKWRLHSCGVRWAEFRSRRRVRPDDEDDEKPARRRREKGRSSREDGSGGGTKRKRPKFIASETFDGQRKGYIFKNGKSGVGYYRDQHRKDVAEATEQPAQPQESAGPVAAPLRRGRSQTAL